MVSCRTNSSLSVCVVCVRYLLVRYRHKINHRSTDPYYESNYNYNTDLDGHLYSYFGDGSEQQVYTMINHDYLVDRDGDHWVRYY